MNIKAPQYGGTLDHSIAGYNMVTVRGTLDHLTFYLCWQSGLDVDKMRSQEYAFTSSQEELIGKSYRPILKLITPVGYLVFRAARNQMDTLDSIDS